MSECEKLNLFKRHLCTLNSSKTKTAMCSLGVCNVHKLQSLQQLLLLFIYFERSILQICDLKALRLGDVLSSLVSFGQMNGPSYLSDCFQYNRKH